MKSSNLAFKAIVAAAVVAAMNEAEKYVRGVSQSDIDEKYSAYPNIDSKGNKNQLIVENIKLDTESKKKYPRSLIAKRKYGAIYAMKEGQSSFFPTPEGRTLATHQSRLAMACNQAKKHTPKAKFVTRQTMLDGVKGVRVFRVK